MDCFDFVEVNSGERQNSIENDPFLARKRGEMKNCTFCGLQVLKSDMLKHTQLHMENWEGAENEDIEESLDESKDVLYANIIKEEIVENDSLKCSFCPEFIKKDKMRIHINEHVSQWETNSSVFKKGVCDTKDKTDKECNFELAEIQERKLSTKQCGEDNYKGKERTEVQEIPDENEPRDLNDGGNTKMEVKAVKCSFCPEYINRADLVQHIQHHSLQWIDNLVDNDEKKTPVNVKNKCRYCGKQLTFKQQWEEHERLHTGEKPLQCSYCDKRYRDKFGLAWHVKTKHDKAISCDQCGKAFDQKRELIKHLHRKHGLDVGFECERCNDVFPSEVTLQNHLKNGSCTNVCTTCGKTFQSKSNLNAHIIIHKDPEESKVLVCDECGKKFSRKSDLEEHIRSHFNRKEFKCKNCGKGFNRKSSLWCHSTKHCQRKQLNDMLKIE